MTATDYSTSKIYRITCSDGKFYIGSTVLALNTRFGQHKRAVENGGKSKLYRHIRALGEEANPQIELVAENLGLTTRDQLLTVEDGYIREALKTKLCLNRNKPRATDEERKAREKLQKRMWKRINRDVARDEGGEKTLAERVREYYRTHKRLPKPRKKKADPQELVGCECGWDIERCKLQSHKKTKEHESELMRWQVRRRFF